MKRNKLTLMIVSVLLVLSTLLTGCTKEQEETPIESKGMSYFGYFDTVSYIFDYSGDSTEGFEKKCDDITDILSEYNELFDIYHEYSGLNNLRTVNKNAGEAVVVDQKLIDFLLYAKELYGKTNGEMNIMLGSVLKLWHNCREAASDNPESATIPSAEELEEASKHISIDLLEIDKENSTVKITDPKASIDVGAVGKGYATEMAAQYLYQENAYGYVLNIGGNIRICGYKPDGSGWVTGIRNPFDDNGDFVARIKIADTACVTSGVYERYYIYEGERYHHIIDKDTLYPASYYVSLTVVTEDSGLADVLSTALFCMPLDEGKAFVENMEGVEVLWILPDGTMEYSSGMNNYLVTNS